ncbi:DNA replication and repair protein RecF [bacterium]|nr:DNA replication and repair protein RecF [bacterium]
MYLKTLKTYSFRNLSDTEIDFHPSVNLISGENGEGKSNLLEAIHVLSATKTFRSVQQRDLARWETGEFSVFGTVALEDKDISDVNLGVSYEGRTKRVFRDGEPTRKVAQYLKNFPTVAFAPRDVDLVYGSPSGRRKLLDRCCSLIFPGYLEALSAYQKVVRSKNALLRDRISDSHQLASLDHLIGEQAVLLTHAREELRNLLVPLLQEFYSSFARDDGEVELHLDESFLRQGANGRTEEEYRAVLEQLLPRELDRRGVLVGPHLDDLSITLGGREAKLFASQGQARSIVLSLLLGIVRVIEEKLGVLPALLLDDFSSELDQGRMTRFFQLLHRNTHQVFITGTDLSHGDFHGAECVHFAVQNGSVRRRERG